MDDLIVIILTLVVTVFGIYNQQRKKKAGMASSNSEAHEPADFWDMIMEETQPGRVEQEAKTVRPEVVEEQKITTRKEPYKFTAKEEGHSQVVKKKKQETARKKVIKVDGESFSLRKAVIYNEVLKRKYL